MTMLERVKTALEVSTNAYDAYLTELIAAAADDLGLAGVNESRESVDNPLIIRAITTFCKRDFDPDGDYDKLNASYNEQKAQLSMATGYTDWGDCK